MKLDSIAKYASGKLYAIIFLKAVSRLPSNAHLIAARLRTRALYQAAARILKDEIAPSLFLLMVAYGSAAVI
jgi:hypothetical protein